MLHFDLDGSVLAFDDCVRELLSVILQARVVEELSYEPLRRVDCVLWVLRCFLLGFYSDLACLDSK